MPTARRSRMIAASADELWEVIGDPHHLPRWWPRVTRVEDVEGDAFTEVDEDGEGKMVRADFQVARERRACARAEVVWSQARRRAPRSRAS